MKRNGDIEAVSGRKKKSKVERKTQVWFVDLRRSKGVRKRVRKRGEKEV
jgi:hypothetical protein